MHRLSRDIAFMSLASEMTELFSVRVWVARMDASILEIIALASQGYGSHLGSCNTDREIQCGVSVA